ncbi:MAG: hypothetical protein Q4F66_11885 [Clostridium sp.]|nr:hypothetical protein [Clostridium sp.]
MDNSKALKKYIIYFAPVILMHMLFTLIDKNIQINGNDLDLRLSIIHMSIYSYFFVIPIYLMIVNVVFNAKNKIEEYYEDTKLGALSIIAGNIVVLIINIVSLYVIKVYDINLIIEFFIILVPEIIMFIMIEFLGSFLVKKQDEDYEEETLEGVQIPKREIEFYKKDEVQNGPMNDEEDYKNSEIEEVNSDIENEIIPEENKTLDNSKTDEDENI